jgi:hypothetical protein
VQHVAAQLKEAPSESLFTACAGIGTYLQESDIQEYVDSALRLLADSKKVLFHEPCRQFVEDLYMKLPIGRDEKLKARVDEWAKFLKERNRPEDAERIDSLSAHFLPF